MRRTVSLIIGVILIVFSGLSLGIIVLRTQAIDQRAIPPVTLKFSCNETPTTNDFERFWSDFRAAVQTDDIDTAYRLTSRCAFSWWNWSRRGVHLKSVDALEALASGNLLPVIDSINAPLAFQSKEDFANNYHAIF